MNQFFLSSASRSVSPSSSRRSSLDTDLPFPAPLPRSDFIAPDFSPSAYLSELAPRRHQALEDLRSDLRTRSQQLSGELLDLVNAHYADFLGLGRSLRGGNEKVQELRVGLIGFRREVEATRNVLVEKEAEIAGYLDQRRLVRQKLQFGRKMLDWEEKITVLQEKLSLDPAGGTRSGVRLRGTGKGGEDSEEEEDYASDEDEVDGSNEGDAERDGTSDTTGLAPMRNRINEYRLLQQIASDLGPDNPFVGTQQHRLTQIRNTLLLDLGNYLRTAGKGPAWDLKVLGMYRDMNAGKDAVAILRQRKSQHDRGRR